MQAVIDYYNNSLVPALKAQKGFQGPYLMTDASNDKAVSVTVWESESESDLAAAESNGAYGEQINKGRELLVATPDVDNYVLSVDASA